MASTCVLIDLDQDTVQCRVLVCWLIWIRILYRGEYVCVDNLGHDTVQ